MDEERRYCIQTASAACVVVGAFLTTEHILTWGGADLVFGHEWIGLIFMIGGTIGSIKSRKKKSLSTK